MTCLQPRPERGCIRARSSHALVALVFACLLASGRLLPAQRLTPSASGPQTDFESSETLAIAELPNAPDPASSSLTPASVEEPRATAANPGTTVSNRIGRPISPPPVAPLFHKYIEPVQTAQPLSAADKVLFGFHQLESPYLLLTVAAAAGYEQALNDSPNYGTNFHAYGQRVGAAAARNASQTIFEDSLMAPILREDPRYYIQGDKHNAIVRAGYAISRVFITRTDTGAATPNLSLFAGYAEAAALEQAYYPPDNIGFSETAKSFAGSLGGAALSNVVREFLPDILHAVHLE